MTKEETKKILTTLRAVYPKAYQGIDKDIAEEMIRIWHKSFESTEYSRVSAAVNSYILTGKYAPTIADIYEATIFMPKG